MSTNPLHELKQVLRQTVREGRRQQFECGNSHSSKLIDLVLSNGLTTVAAYEEFDNEPSLAYFREWCSMHGVKVLLPKIHGPYELQWTSGGNLCQLADAELIMMPALAAGRDGNRLGRGKGYYDRAVANLETPRVVVVHDSELFETIPAEALDQKVSTVVTCSEILKLDNRLN